MDNEDEGARLTQQEENRELIAKHRAEVEMWAIAERKKVMDAHRLAATVEPRGCPTPGACSCPGTIPAVEREKVMTAHMLAESIVERATVDTPRTDAEVIIATSYVQADFARTLERELIDLKQRILPQANGRAERAEKARQMAVVERDAILEELIAAPSATGATDLDEFVRVARTFSDEHYQNALVAELRRVYHAQEETVIGHARYEYVRKLSLRQFAKLYDEVLRGSLFDDVVDRDMKGEKHG